MKKIVVKVEIHDMDGIERPTTLETFDIVLNTERKPEKNRYFSYIAKFGKKTYNIDNFPAWLPKLHLVKIALNQALKNKTKRNEYFTLPKGWNEEGRLYEITCEHGIGHYTGVSLPHGCDGCCSKIKGLFPWL